MAPNPEASGFSTLSFSNNTGQARAGQKKDNKGRKFFQQMQPTFSIDVPTTTYTQLEFLDNFDPAKDTVVRKKAREWVNKNREISNLSGQATSKSRPKSRAMKSQGEDQEKQLTQRKSTTPLVKFSPKAVSASSVDPFGLLPNIGRNFDHIIKYFLSASCPEEIPCSDDKYADKSKHALTSFQHENTILGSMAKSELTFVLWLYATVVIRDGTLGALNTEEVYWFYNKSLKSMQETIQRETAEGNYSDHLINAVACITAAAVFGGMFTTSITHRDALVRLLTCRGDGDLLVGLQSTSRFTRKASRWCEILVAAQLAELPQLPYQHSAVSPLPEQIIVAAEGLTTTTLQNLPYLSEALVKIVRWFHQIVVSSSSPPPPGVKVDDYVIQPMYDGEYTLLAVLAAQRKPEHGFTEAEVLLAESLQLWFWTTIRSLPPQTKLCDRLTSRVMKALLPLLHDASSELALEADAKTGASSDGQDDPPQLMPDIQVRFYRFLRHTREVNNVITWALAFGTLLTAPLLSPEHSWFKEHFRLQIRAMGLHRDENQWLEFLKLFPSTDASPNPWVKLRDVWRDFGAQQIDELFSQ
ncbi:hypothetical protein C7974DRAFT_57103 [Boeremia exigua]|uniref:uncharacterized protein n=1 Tax=Boeremia exigua TaxID=749465 RepID=UPI001E8DB9A4|nr:uncharacterized protein C7974DRAFT_57103 [Boeremia exigua]KAH6614992.1 hypothetical protein C7974DRAFT_57103 [Boeremia exigua]